MKSPDEEDKDLAFKGFLKEREYLIKAGDESSRQLDQLIFYTSSAAIGLSITQLGTASTYYELVALAIACLLFILTIATTYMALRCSADAFEATREDADQAQTVPYEKSVKTTKIETQIVIFERIQAWCFPFALLALVFFMGFRTAIVVKSTFFNQLPPKSNILEKVETTMTEQKKEIRENTQQKKSNIHEHAVKPKPPAPIKPANPKPTTTPTKKNS